MTAALYDLTGYTQAELGDLLADQREQMTFWARIALAAPTAKGRRTANSAHDDAQDLATQVLDEYAARRGDRPKGQLRAMLLATLAADQGDAR